MSHEIEDFIPRTPGQVGLYVCGMTVYDHAHIGHARSMVVYDAFVRWLRANHWKVTFVRNFTDVDDKIIIRAAESGEDPEALAERHIQSFRDDASGLRLLPPNNEPRVSQSIEQIQNLIRKLLNLGYAYVSEGSVWFIVERFSDYGKLSRQRPEHLLNTDNVSGKRRPADFALWKASKPGEPSWESPWGPGRPGWHIECSAMAHTHLGASFDIHGGGIDLIFPHHENEIAQFECAHGLRYASYWMHNGMLVVDTGQKMKGGGDYEEQPQKMSKSLGNVFNIREALERFPAEALRFYYLNAHYRSPLIWNDKSLGAALSQLMRLYDARERAEEMGGEGQSAEVITEMGEAAQSVWEQGRTFKERFDEALTQDFNTPKAISYLFELARAINRFAEEEKALKRGGPVVAPALKAFAYAADHLGVLSLETEEFHAGVKAKYIVALGLTEADILALIADRAAFRKARQWDEADRIRQELAQRQISLMDHRSGTTWRILSTTTSVEL